MEVITDDFLYIWHCNFGAPGSKNDINFLNQSSLFNKIRMGLWPPQRPETNVSGLPLTDGIYPKYRIFV